MSKIRLIKEERESSITIKGSKFISYTYKVSSKDDVDLILNSLKKEHFKSTHICYAYRIGKEDITEFSTDAGEPSGTAGKPILGVIQKYDVYEIMVVVVRYFGGTKLGIRGLIDAYHESAEQVMKETSFLIKGEYELIMVFIKYTYLATVEYKVRDRNGLWLNLEYGNDGADVTIGFPTEDLPNHEEWLEEMLGTKMIEKMERLGKKWINVKIH
jgi:uncharacterized YigZ family protein